MAKLTEQQRDDLDKSDFADPDAVRWHIKAFLDFYRKHAATMRALQQAALVNEAFAGKLARFGADESADILGHLKGLALPADPRVSITMMTALTYGNSSPSK